MIPNADWRPLIDELEIWQKAGRTPLFWLRDDDAIEPTPALDRLVDLTFRHSVPLGLAVIPALAGGALAARIATEPHVTVLVHGWNHVNHAGPGEKKQELGLHRPLETVLSDLASGLTTARTLFGQQAASILVPPWNRIDSRLLPHLPGLGFTGLSVFGRPFPAPVRILNSTVDIIDWHGNRGGRDHAVLVGEIVSQLREAFAASDHPPVGILAHHLVHDAAAWSFLDGLFAATQAGDACAWLSVYHLGSG